MMKVYTRLIVLLLCAVLLCGCGGDVSHVSRVVGPSEIFTGAEIEGAMAVVANYFKQEFDGCTLTELHYDEAAVREEQEEWAAQYDAEEAIVLLSTFDVDSSGGDGSLNPDSTYRNWKWILVRTKFGWDLKTWGYG